MPEKLAITLKIGVSDKAGNEQRIAMLIITSQTATTIFVPHIVLGYQQCRSALFS